MAKKWKKKEIEDYISTKQISQENYVAPTVQTGTAPSYKSVASTVDAFNSVQPTIKSVDSTIDDNNKFSFSIDNKKEEPTTGQKLGFVGKSAGAGLVSGLTGIADAPLQNIQEGAQKGKKKGKLENYLQGLARTLDIYGLSTMPETAKEVQQIVQDKNKKGWQKALNIGGAILNNNPLVNNLEAAGQQLNIFDKNAEKDIANVRKKIETPSNKLNENVAKDSEKMGKGWQIAGEVSQTIGNMIPSMALTAVTKNPDIGLAAMGVSAKGQATKEAEERGADLNTANEIGLGKGLVEVGTEKLTGGLKFFGKGTADDLVEKGINKVIKNKAGNFIAKQAAGMAGEVGEETISDLVGTAIDKATIDPDASYSFDDWKKTALMTMLSTGALNTISGGYGRKAYQLNAEELNDIAQSKKVQDTVNERVEQFKTPDMTPEQVEQLREQTTAVVLGEIQQNVDDILDNSIAQLQEQPQIPTQTPLNEVNQGVLQQNNQILGQQQTPQITPLNQVNQELQETRQNDIANQVQAMNLEQEPQFTQKQGNYVYEKSDNSKIDNLRKDAATYLKEGEQTTNFVNTLEKLVKDKDIEIRFDTKLGNNVNGTYKNGVITINPNSNRAGEFVAIHELTHAIGTKPMIDMIQTYRKSNAEFNNAVERLLSTYKTTEINEEALGDIAGQLFGNQEYINNLSMENPSLFKKIYNEIKYLWHQFTGYKNQNQFIEDLRNKWESAYRNQQVQQKAKNSNIEMSNQTDSNGNMLSNEQVDYFKDSKVRDENGNLLVMYHGTEANVGLPENEKFTVFDRDKAGNNGTYYGAGFYFTSNPEFANEFAKGKGDVYKVYLKMENPYKPTADTINTDGSVNFAPSFYEDFENRFKNDISLITDWSSLTNKQKGRAVRNILQDNGYDGIVNGNNYVVFEPNQIKNIDNLTPTQDDDIRYSTEEVKKEPTKDNTGKELSKQQQEYFKDTKVRDNDGNLITVYHTTTNAIDQFNEFNPVGTDYYKFGDQVVNYYTNSKDMSGSYANQDYVMADTSKITSMDEVNKLIEEHNNNLSIDERYDYNVGIIKDGNGYKLKVTSQPGASYSGVIEEFYPRKYKNDIDLFKRIKDDLKNYRTIRNENGRALSKKNKIQYEGYVNITNPYIVDAEKRNWNQVVSQSNNFIDELDERIPQDIKNNLTRLYQESANKSAEAREKYSGLQDMVNHVRFTKSMDENIQKTIEVAKRVGINELEDALEYDGQMGIIGVNGWYKLADELETQGIIGESTAKLIMDDFKLPEQVKETIKKYYNEPIDRTAFYLDFNSFKKSFGEQKKVTLKEIFKKDMENYNEFDKYRMPNSYFLEELKKEGNDYLGYDLEDMFETRAEVMGADTVADEISQAASVGFSKPEMIRLWGTSKTTNDVVKEVIASNKDGKTNYDGVIIKNVYDYGGYTDEEKNANDLYITFNSNQFKNIDNTNPTEDSDIRYSKDNQTWKEYLEKEFPSQGTRTNLQDINERNKPKQENKTIQEEKPQEMPKKEVKKEAKKSYLTSAEQNELDGLKAVENSGFAELTSQEQARMEELEKKSQGITKKFPELNKTVTQEDTKPLYFKYKDSEISRENNKILNEAKNIVEANKQGRRTKEQWLQVAEYIGSNADIKNSQDLQKLAMETWLASRPNNRDNLNRQGKKYVDFKTNEWFNAMYKGAGVGTDVKMSLEEATDTKGNKVDLKPTGNNTYEQVNVKSNKNDVIPDMSNKVLNMGNEKVSNFYSNITEKSKFITEENRETLKDNANLQYYDAITNKETLENAMDKLNNNTEKQVGDFFAKKDFDAEDVATGWILVKRYQDAGNYEAMTNVIEKMREQGTKAGQTVQAYGILQRLTPEGMEYYSQKQLDKAFNEYSKNKSKKQIEKYANDFTLTAEEHQFIKDQMEKVQNTTDEETKKVEIAKIVSMLSDKMPPAKGQRIKAWMRIAMLGNPKTQVRNVAGNAIIQPVNWVGDVFSATADKIISKKTGVRTKGATDFGALVQGTKKGFKDAVRDAKTGVDTRDINLDRFEENIGSKPFYEGHKSKLLNAGAKALNKTNKILGNVMSGGDRIFYQAVYDNSLQNQMKLNGVDTPTQEMIDIATNEALQRTWNDSNEYTKAVLQIRNAMNKLNVKGYGLGDVLVPFAKTPANLTKAIVDYSPVGLARTIYQDGKNLKNSLENGQYNAQLQHKFADSLGKGFAGTLLYLTAYALAQAGITSGASDDDKDVANFMRNTLGIQPYSVKVGDKSFTYDWAQPIAAPFAIMSDAKRLSEVENKDLGSIIKTATSSASNILLEQSFLSSIQDVFNSYEGPSAAIKQQIQDLPARATPTFFKQIADLIDPTQRQTYVKGNEGETLKNKVQTKIPGASKDLTAQRDTLGREIKKYGGDEDKLKYAFNVFLNPANTNKGKPSEAAEEIYEVYKETGNKKVMPKQVGYSERIGKETRNLTAEERSKLQKLSGEKIEENVKTLTSNSKYQSMSYEDKAEVIQGIVDYSMYKAKSDMFNTNIASTYKTAAKKEEQGIPIADYYIERISKRR